MHTVLATLATVVVLFLTGTNLPTLLVAIPLVMTAAYISAKLAERISRRVAPRPPASAAPAAPVEATTDRPDHVRRLRDRRRRRAARPRRE